MKKIIMGIAFAVACCNAFAINVKWGLGTAEVLDADKVGYGATMYLCLSSTAATPDWTALQGQESFTEDTLAAVGFDKIVDSFTYADGKVSQTKGLNLSSGYGSGSKSLYVVAIADDGQYLAYSPTAQTVTISNMTTTFTKTQPGSAFSYVAAESIPEPTSGILLLLGMAGLALRRRRA